MSYKHRRRRQPKSDVALYSLILIAIGAFVVANWLSLHPTLILPLVGLFLFLLVLAGASFYWWHQVRATRVRFHAQTLSELLTLTPAQFEHAIADLLTSLGYRKVRVLGKSGDLMADIVSHDPAGRLTVCQCKRYQKGALIGSPEIQKFIGMCYAHHRATRALYVTTSGFTAPARKLAEQHNITLWDGAALTAQIQSLHLPALPVV